MSDTTMTSPSGETPSEQRSHNGLLAVLILGCTAILVAVTWWLMPKNAEDEVPGSMTVTPAEVTPGSPSERTTILTDIGDDHVFTLTMVTNALEAITLPAPAELDAAADVADYQELLANQSVPRPTFAAGDTAYSLRFDDQTTYSAWLQGNEQAPELYQMYDELQYIASVLDAEFAVLPLYEQADAVEVVIPITANPFDGRAETVYPSQRAVAGFFVGEMMALADPLNAEAYQAAAQDFAERGIVYGHYGASSVAVSEALVTQYLELAIAANPEVFTNLTQ